MEDFTSLAFHIKDKFKLDPDSPIIGFGGSYGGMLAAWMRLKFPHLIDGSIAASAPIWVYPGVKSYDTYGFFKVITNDYIRDGGNICKSNIQKLWAYLFKLGDS